MSSPGTQSPAPRPRRRHIAAQARMATVLISAGGFAGIVAGQAVTSGASTPAPATGVAPSATSTPAAAGQAPAAVSPTPAPADQAPAAAGQAPVSYAGIPAPFARRRPTVFSRGS